MVKRCRCCLKKKSPNRYTKRKSPAPWNVMQAIVSDNLKNYWESLDDFSMFHNCLSARLKFDLLQLALNMKVQQKLQINRKRILFLFSTPEQRGKKFSTCSQVKVKHLIEERGWGDKWRNFYGQKQRKPKARKKIQNNSLFDFLPSGASLHRLHRYFCNLCPRQKKVNIPESTPHNYFMLALGHGHFIQFWCCYKNNNNKSLLFAWDCRYYFLWDFYCLLYDPRSCVWCVWSERKRQVFAYKTH